MKTTAEKLQDYLTLLMDTFTESIKNGKAPSDERMRLLDEKGLEMAGSVKRDARDAERWRKYVKDTEEAVVMFEMKKGIGMDKKGRMN